MNKYSTILTIIYSTILEGPIFLCMHCLNQIKLKLQISEMHSIIDCRRESFDKQLLINQYLFWPAYSLAIPEARFISRCGLTSKVLSCHINNVLFNLLYFVICRMYWNNRPTTNIWEWYVFCNAVIIKKRY